MMRVEGGRRRQSIPPPRALERDRQGTFLLLLFVFLLLHEGFFSLPGGRGFASGCCFGAASLLSFFFSSSASSCCSSLSPPATAARRAGRGRSYRRLALFLLPSPPRATPLGLVLLVLRLGSLPVAAALRRRRRRPLLLNSRALGCFAQRLVKGVVPDGDAQAAGQDERGEAAEHDRGRSCSLAPPSPRHASFLRRAPSPPWASSTAADTQTPQALRRARALKGSLSWGMRSVVVVLKALRPGGREGGGKSEEGGGGELGATFAKKSRRGAPNPP
jgi:hypothetical protein